MTTTKQTRGANKILQACLTFTLIGVVVAVFVLGIVQGWWG